MLVSVIIVMIVMSFAVPAIIYVKGNNKIRSAKRALAFNIGTYFSAIVAANIIAFANIPVFAAGGAGVAQISVGTGLAYIAAALCTFASTIGAGIAVGASTTAAIGAISENEKLFGKALIYVAMAEGIALYGLLVSILIINNI
ncbi:MAG: ATP synthase subunit C [Bacillota bacterium]|nr:ATP synthase subunit C [Bacillota bacterium]